MIYLLDTDTLIYMVRYLKPARRPSQRERGRRMAQRCRTAQAAGDAVGLSAITVSELEHGAQHSGDYDREIAAVHKLLAPFVLYDYDSVSCPVHYGRVRDELEANGIPIGSMDLLIAAHALALDATLVSNNLAHFSRVSGLQTVNWLA
jgi:tRNA(fMet)-specific endonuclease VapC